MRFEPPEEGGLGLARLEVEGAEPREGPDVRDDASLEVDSGMGRRARRDLAGGANDSSGGATDG